jgi:hypothetical protein
MDPLGAVGVLYIMYLAFSKATIIILSITTIPIIVGEVAGSYKYKT